MMEMALGLQGLEVTSASNGFEALEAVTTRQFDLIILDNWMPELTEVDLCKMIRKADQKPPIISFLVRDMKNDEAEAFSAGPDGYLGKLIDLENLVACLHVCFTKRPTEQNAV